MKTLTDLHNEHIKPMRNPPKQSQRRTEANARKTAKRIDEYLGVQALLRTWEQTSTAIQCRNYDYILKLRRRERIVKNYLQHRAGPDADL